MSTEFSQGQSPLVSLHFLIGNFLPFLMMYCIKKYVKTEKIGIEFSEVVSWQNKNISFLAFKSTFPFDNK